MLKQHEFERAMYKELEYGDETYLAEKRGVSSSYYSQMLNPEDPRESTWFRTAQDFFHLVERDKQRGGRLLARFVAFVERAMPAAEELCITNERRKTLKEWQDWILADIENKPLEEQIGELEEFKTAVDRLLAAKLQLRARTNGGGIKAATVHSALRR